MGSWDFDLPRPHPSLNLASHGARAEKSVFNITLQRDFDAAAGSAELFPQEITRALLNLISNGFYAATFALATLGDLWEVDKNSVQKTIDDNLRRLVLVALFLDMLHEHIT